jgi:hypothetical protein
MPILSAGTQVSPSRLWCIRSMRKEIKYWSSNLKQPYFVYKTDPFEFPHDRFPAHPGHKNHFQPTQKTWKQYDDYFTKLKTNPLPEGQIVARVGHNTVNVAQLNSLAPNTWLFGTILYQHTLIYWEMKFTYRTKRIRIHQRWQYSTTYSSIIFLIGTTNIVTRMRVPLQ